MHVVVSDLREELVAYVNGIPYLRRELEMPHAALHHAGQLNTLAATSTGPSCLPNAARCSMRIEFLQTC